MTIEFKSITDMKTAILHNLHKFPHDIDLVVGIPRSGMLPANLIALYLNKPFTDIDSFIDGRIYSSGERKKFNAEFNNGKILIVDDSIAQGVALEKAKEKFAANEKFSNMQLIWAVIYASEKGKDKVDIYCEETSLSRIFEWNLFHHPYFISHCCCDIDGVLCPNPPIDDDGPQYIKYLTEAPVLFKPSVKVHTLVSCRLEKYRNVTERWLDEKGILYDNLIMLDMSSKEERQRWGKHGEYKAKVYNKSNNKLFIESSYQEALVIFNKTKKPVFCIETFSMMCHMTITEKIKHFIKKKKLYRLLKH